MGVANAVQEMHAPRPRTRRQARVMSQRRMYAVDRLLGRLEAAVLGGRQLLEPDLWERLQGLSLELEVPLPSEIDLGIGLDRLHALLLDWQEEVMNHEFPDRRAFIDREG